jgi:hypothetical protein
MKLMAVLVMVGLLSAVELVDPAICGRSETYIDNGQICDLLHRPLPQSIRGEIVLVDSSGNAYSAWTKIQECLAYNPVVEGLQFVNRGYDPTGVLNVHQTDASFSFWIHDFIVYNQQIPPATGGARYPTSGAATNPLISFVTLDIGPAFHGGVAQYEEGGWYSSFWADPVDLAPACHKFIGKELPDGNILFIGLGLSDEIFYVTTSSDLQTIIASGILGYGNYWGFDINGGIAYVFYYDASLNVYYQTTTDGVTWSGEQTYDLVWPNPYTNSGLYWTQMALTDAGNPILEFDIVDNDDTTYPWDGIVYVSIAESQPCIAVSPEDTTAFWGTIATGGDFVVVMYQLPANDYEADTACHDQWFNWSGDNGATWHTPQNLTASFNHPTGLAQLAKRVNATDGKFYYFFCVNMVGDWDPFFGIAYGTHGADPHAFYVGWNEIEVGIEEETRSMKTETRLTVYPNPFSKLTKISFGKEHPDRITHSSYGTGSAKGIELKIYAASGRLVKNFNLKSKISNLQSEVSWNGVNNAGQKLPCGVYFIQLGGHKTTSVKKVIKLE